jgi:nitroreductase
MLLNYDGLPVRRIMMNDPLKILYAHRSVRTFTDKAVEPEKVEAIIEAAQWAATSSHFQAYTIIRVDDPAKREKFAVLAGGQSWIEKCPLFLIFCADLQRSKKYWEELDVEIVGNMEMLIMATVDVTLAAQKAMIAAQFLGLGGVFIGGIRNDLDQASALLKLPELVFPLFGMCLGYPAEDNPQKPRLPKDVIFKRELYHEDGDQELIEEYEELMRNYYRDRSGGIDEVSWSERSAAYMMAKPRPDVGPHLRGKGFAQR